MGIPMRASVLSAALTALSVCSGSLAVPASASALPVTTRVDVLELSRTAVSYPSVAPLDGETVGVGMPVVVRFDAPVESRESFERRLVVTSLPEQPGAWHWVSDREVHWRPQSYWKPHSKVTVSLDLGGLPAAGGGVYGASGSTVRFRTGDAHVYRVNTQTHKMRVWSNHHLLRTIPITTGKQGFETRSGVKVILEKFPVKEMNAATIGIRPGDAEYYDIDDVRWAMRLTYSGEFIHAAPWSVGSQGSANVSHGCTGMSTENAHWLFAMSRRGDVVEYTGTRRRMTLTNGFGDWNLGWRQWLSGSATAGTSGQ